MRLDCYIDGSSEVDPGADGPTTVDYKLIIGAGVTSAGYLDVSKAVRDLDEALARLREVPAAVWEELSAIVPGGLSAEDALHLTSHAAHDFSEGLTGVLVFGERTEDHDRDHVYTGSKLMRWAVRGVKVAEVHSLGSSYAIVDASPDAHAERRAMAQAMGVDPDAAAYYLILGRRQVVQG